jgi:AcrR family transcriptional regulator
MRYTERGSLSRGVVLAHAVVVAAAEGIDAVTFRRLAEDLRRSRSGIFELFGSAERLRTAVVDFAADQFHREVLDPSRSRRGAIGLRLMLDRWLDNMMTCEGLVLARAAVLEWDDDEYRPFQRLGLYQDDIIEGCILFGVKFGQMKREVDQRELALDLFILGSGCAAALLALGPRVRDRLEKRIDERFADFLTPQGMEEVAREMAAVREKDWW